MESSVEILVDEDELLLSWDLRKVLSSLFISVFVFGIKSSILYSLLKLGLFLFEITLNMFSYFCGDVFTKSLIFGTVNVDLKNSIR
jgi:hypothetical protein